MPLEIPLPTASPENDPAQYTPLLLSAIEGFLLAKDVWEASEYDDARQYMEQLMSFIVVTMKDAAMGRPIGQITMYGNASPANGWLPCDGRTVSRSDYAELFDVIGETFGDGDGSTTFNVPDMQDRSPIGFGGAVIIDVGDVAGAMTHALTTAELPAHNHSVNDPGHNHAPLTGQSSIWGVGTGTGAVGGGSSSVAKATTASNTTGISTNNSGSGTAHTNLHPVLAVCFMIYAGV